MHRCLAAAVRSLVALVVAVLSMVPGYASVDAQPPSRPAAPAQTALPAQTAPGCTIRETSRTPLVVQGARELYIEPNAVLPSRGEVMLAGTPNYLFAPGGVNDFRDFVQDSVFGAIVGADGKGRLVPAPIDPSRLIDVHGLVLSDGTWGFTFAELTRPRQPQARDTVMRYWYGVFDGKTWTRLEPLPGPPYGQLNAVGASNLLVQGDTTFFAVRVDRAEGSNEVGLYERRQGKWNLTMVRPPGLAYLRLLYSATEGLLLSIVRTDRSLTEDSNALFLHSRPESWATFRKLLPGLPEPVHQPEFASTDTGVSLTWLAATAAGGEARAMLPPLDAASPVLKLDVPVQQVVHVPGLRAGPLWVTHNLGPNGLSRIRFVGYAADGRPLPLAEVANPYTGLFGAAAIGTEEFLVSGPLLRRDSPNPSLVTLLIRARVECAPRAP